MELGKTKQIKDNPPICPNEDCQTKLDAVNGVGHDGLPSEGDITVCLGCAWVLQFDENLQLSVFQMTDYINMDAEDRALLDEIQSAAVIAIENRTKH